MMSKSPITQKQYQTVMGNNPSRFEGDENYPVEQVSWHEAVAFCQKLAQIVVQRFASDSMQFSEATVSVFEL